jgi:hypothetical protein
MVKTRLVGVAGIGKSAEPAPRTVTADCLAGSLQLPAADQLATRTHLRGVAWTDRPSTRGSGVGSAIGGPRRLQPYRSTSGVSQPGRRRNGSSRQRAGSAPASPGIAASRNISAAWSIARGTWDLVNVSSGYRWDSSNPHVGGYISRCRGTSMGTVYPVGMAPDRTLRA